MFKWMLVFILFASPIDPATPPVLIVWNVGQGAWITLVTNSECWHYDMGGEHFPIAQVEKKCHNKRNIVSFTHWDQDHIGFAGRSSFYFNTCISKLPIGPSTPRKVELLNRLRNCPSTSPFEKEIPVNTENFSKSNELSRVFEIARALYPGDSTDKAEKQWAPKITSSKINVLILGHHGSRTSTSEDLLKHLPSLKLAIASARRQKYGHPHVQTLSRLKAHGVPTISTEEWGSIELGF